MKSKTKLYSLVACGVIAAVGGTVVCSSNAASLNFKSTGALGQNEYYHFAGVAATCETVGVHDYYTNCTNVTSLTLPTGGTVKAEKTLTEAQFNTIVADTSDIRYIPAKGHNFNAISGECSHDLDESWTDAYYTAPVGSADGPSYAEVTSDKSVPDGFTAMYKIRHTYNDGVSYHIKRLFNDKSLDSVNEFSFYIDPNGVQFFFAGPDGAASTGYQLHPNESFVDHGTIVGRQISNKTWEITANGFKFRRMSDGAAISTYTFVIPEAKANTLNTLFNNTNGWGANTVYVSDVKVTGSECCGHTSIMSYNLKSLNPYTVDTTYSSNNLGTMYQTTAAKLNDKADIDITNLTEIKFRLVNPDTGNTFILKGNTSNCVGGIYGGENNADTIIATKSGSTWTVKRASGGYFFELPSWSDKANYTVEGATKFSDLFSFFTYASNVYVSDIVVKGDLAYTRTMLANETAFRIYNKYPEGHGYLTETGSTVFGFDKLYTYTRTYYGSDTKQYIDNIFEQYDLTDVSSVEFYIASSGEFFMGGDDGTASTSIELHPSAGAGLDHPGILRATQTSAGTWKLTANGFLFRKMGDGAQVSEFTFTNRTNLQELIHNFQTWGASEVVVSGIVVCK